MKKQYKCIILFIMSSLICFIYNFLLCPIDIDELYNYGFGYNIANGSIIYKDFNMVITPLYPILTAIFIKIFGSYLYSMHIINSLLFGISATFLYKQLGFKSVIIFSLLLFGSKPGYNFLTLVIMIILLYFNNNQKIKEKDIILGIITGLLLLTKQSIGIFIFIPLLIFSKNKIKTIVSFSIPIIIFIMYLLFNHSLQDFINYCFLGLFEFGTKNIDIYIHLVIIEILICIYLIYKIIKSNLKDTNAIYVLCYQILSYPICDHWHTIPTIIMFLIYFISKNKLNKKELIILGIITNLFSFSLIYNYNIENEKLNYTTNKDSFLLYKQSSKNITNNSTTIINYINNQSYDYLFNFNTLSFLIKIELNDKINKYDLINNGNMGYKGDIKIINEVNSMCKNNKCIFILDHTTKGQTNKNITNFVKNNYQKKDTIDIFTIYSNY